MAINCRECEMFQVEPVLCSVGISNNPFYSDKELKLMDGYVCTYNGVRSIHIEDLQQKGNCRLKGK